MLRSLEALCRGAVDDAVAALAAERLAPLAFEELRGSNQHAGLRAALKPHVLAATARDLAQTAALIEVAEIARTQMLVFKGAANGPRLYSSGALRPRADIDVWVDGWESAERLARRLEGHGWSRVHQLPGTVARHAIALSRGPAEDIDVHAVSSRRVRVARALPFSEAWAERATVMVDGARLNTLSARHAWFVGALHTSAHHAGQTTPKVLVEDLRRLAARLEPADWQWIWDTASAHGLLSAMRDGGRLLADWAPGTMPPALERALERAPTDASTLFGHPVLAILDDLDHLDGPQARRYLAELLFPPDDYLYAHYGVARDRPPTLLHVHRLLSGVVARVAPRGHNRSV